MRALIFDRVAMRKIQILQYFRLHIYRAIEETVLSVNRSII